MGIKTVPHSPYSPDLAACDFWLFPKLRGCRYEIIEEMKESVTKVIDMLTREDFHGAFLKFFRMIQQVHCSRMRLLQRGIEFHMCTINRSGHTKKSLGTYLMILVCFFVSFQISHGIKRFKPCQSTNNTTNQLPSLRMPSVSSMKGIILLKVFMYLQYR